MLIDQSNTVPLLHVPATNGEPVGEVSIAHIITISVIA
jgi:hypothetical protein